MARKTTTKKVVAKKTVLKKSSIDLKKLKKKIAAVPKPAGKKNSQKNVVNSSKIKKSAKQKTIDKKVTNKISMMKTKGKKKVEEIIEKVSPSASEIRQKAIEKIKGYSKKDLEHFRAGILAKRDEIIEQLQNLKDQMLDPTTGEYINENSPYSLHMAEQGTDAMEREKTFLYAQRENKFLGYLEDALKRIDAGTYGICIDCIDEPQHLCPTCPLIPKARLEAVPHSQLCLPIKQKQEKK